MSRPRRWAIRAILFIIVLVLVRVSFFTFFRGGKSFEFCHYAEIASNIVQGRGFTTRSVSPTDLALLKQSGVTMAGLGPVSQRFPLYAYWCALWMQVGGVGDSSMVLANAVAHALWVVLIFWTGVWLFNERVGGVAALLWAIHPLMIGGFDILGYSDVLFGFLFGLLNLFWWRYLQDSKVDAWWKGVVLGMIAGLCFLGRHNFAFWFPIFLWCPFVLRREKPLLDAVGFLAGFLVLVLPWTVFYLRNNGWISPSYFMVLLADGVLVRSMAWQEYRVYHLADFFAPEAVRLLAWKAYFNFNLFLKDLPVQWMFHLIFPFAVFEMIFSTATQRRFAGWLALLLAWQAVLFSFLQFEILGLLAGRYDLWFGPLTGRYYLWAAPFALLYAVSFFERKFSSVSWRWAAGMVGVCVLSFWFSAFCFLRPREVRHDELPIAQWPEIEYIRDHTRENVWIMSNVPAQISWYARRNTVNITSRPQEVPQLVVDWPVDYLFLSYASIGELGNYPEWTALLRGQLGIRPDVILREMGFVLDKQFEAGLLFRRIRG